MIELLTTCTHCGVAGGHTLECISKQNERAMPGSTGVVLGSEGDSSIMGTDPTSGLEATLSQGNINGCLKCRAIANGIAMFIAAIIIWILH